MSIDTRHYNGNYATPIVFHSVRREIFFFFFSKPQGTNLTMGTPERTKKKKIVSSISSIVHSSRG